MGLQGTVIDNIGDRITTLTVESLGNKTYAPFFISDNTSLLGRTLLVVIENDPLGFKIVSSGPRGFQAKLSLGERAAGDGEDRARTVALGTVFDPSKLDVKNGTLVLDRWDDDGRAIVADDTTAASRDGANVNPSDRKLVTLEPAKQERLEPAPFKAAALEARRFEPTPPEPPQPLPSQPPEPAHSERARFDPAQSAPRSEPAPPAPLPDQTHSVDVGVETF
jgi:hypothetical protein